MRIGLIPLFFILLIIEIQVSNGGKILKKLTKELKKVIGGAKFEDFISDNIADTTSMQANISANVADIENIETNNGILMSSIQTNNAIIGNNTYEIAKNTENIATHDEEIATNAANITNIDAQIEDTVDMISSMQADIGTNAANVVVNVAGIDSNSNNIQTNNAIIGTNTNQIATNAANIASILPTGIFKNCVNQWCLQNGLTYPQYTKCESIADNGWTCNKPGIRYGNVYGPGRPSINGGNDYDLWCQQLGGSNYVTHSEGNAAGYPSEFCVFGCTEYDDTNWHWCDCKDGYWYNESLDNIRYNFNSVVNITCS